MFTFATIIIKHKALQKIAPKPAHETIFHTPHLINSINNRILNLQVPLMR